MALVPSGVFHYVVGQYVSAPIAFGTSSQREVLPNKGTNRFTSANTTPLVGKAGPNTYDSDRNTAMVKRVMNKVTSTRGSGGLCRFEPRFKLTYEVGPTPNTYDLKGIFTKSAPNKKPFNSSKPRIMFTCNNYPGPGTYSVNLPRDRRIRFWKSFGGQKTMDPAVDVKCVSINLDVCTLCQNKPVGDYWHRNNKEFLCRPCMADQYGKKSNYLVWQLQQFRKVRDCSFMHSHEETTAAVIIMEPRKVRTLREREAYACLYFSR